MRADHPVEIQWLGYRESGYDTELTGAYESSCDVLNKLVEKSSRTLYVCMRDNFMDCPDRGKDYGTVILAGIDPGSTSLFLVGGSAGAVGLTVYYPDQNIHDPKEYGWTFEIRGSGHGELGIHAGTVQNVTLINSYRGIGVNAPPYESAVHELSRINNVKGSVLYRGVDGRNCSDVSSWRNIHFSSRYWSEAPAEFNPPVTDDIREFTRKRGTAFTFADVEWDNFYDLEASDFRVGIHLVKGAIDSRSALFGVSFAMSTLEASQHVFVNRSAGFVQIAQCRISGPMPRTIWRKAGTLRRTLGKVFCGRIILDERDFKVQEYNLLSHDIDAAGRVLYDATAEPFKAPCSLGELPEADAGAAIQKAIDAASADGGGIVYLRAGWYLLETNLSIPGNVELRGSSPVLTRSQGSLSNGTVLMLKPQGEEASATISGDYAGIS